MTDDTGIITVLHAEKRTGKSYRLSRGTLAKTSVATAAGRALGRRADTAVHLAEILSEVTSDAHAVVIPGHFVGNDQGQPFNIVYEQELARLMGKTVGDDALAGLHSVGGERYAARLKRSIEPCAWLLIDCDTPEGMPADLAALSLAERLARLDAILPGISACERVELRSSSARIVAPGVAPGRASHAWLRVSHPHLVPLLRVHVQVEAALHGLSFESPRRSTKDGSVIGKARLTLIDLAVWISGRIVFCSAPVIEPRMAKAGWTVADAGITIVNPGGGVLDIGHLVEPSRARLDQYMATTAEHLSITRQGQSYAVVSRGPLTMDTAIDVPSRRSLATFGDAVRWIHKHDRTGRLRCQTPFRASVSEAAFIRIDPAGEPFLYDVGTNTSYRLAERLNEPPPADDSARYGKTITRPAGPPPSISSPISDNDYGARRPEIDCDPLSLKSNGESIAAVIDILRNHPAWRGVLAFDRFSLRVMLMKPLPRTGPQTQPDQWTARAMRDVDGTNALAWFHQLGLVKLKIGALHNAMVAVATDNGFHPVLDYFAEVRAGPGPAEVPSAKNAHLIDPDLPQVDALSLWLTLGFGAEDNLINRAISRAYMIAVVRRVRQPGCQQDYMLVLVAGQGEMKSTGLRILVGSDWFADRMPPIENKDALIQLHGKLVIEWPEVEHLGNKHKGFISSPIDEFRAPYGRAREGHPRTCSFCGTTNFGTFVDDASGARRYWPVPVTTGDRDWLAANRNLIWRLACEAEAAGEVAWLNTPELQKLIRLRQDDAQQPDPWTELIIEKAESSVRSYGRTPPFPGIAVNAAFLHSVFGNLAGEHMSPKDIERATKCFMRAGWRRGTGRAYKRWFPPTQPVHGLMSAKTYALIAHCLLPGNRRAITDSHLLDASQALAALKADLVSADEEAAAEDVTNGSQ